VNKFSIFAVVIAVKLHKPKKLMEKSETKEILKALSEIDKKLTKKVDLIAKDLTEVKENVRKLMKIVPIENADFKVSVTKNKPSHSSAHHSSQRLAVKAQV
jgi:predicted component of type VI protein secretion system